MERFSTMIKTAGFPRQILVISALFAQFPIYGAAQKPACNRPPNISILVLTHTTTGLPYNPVLKSQPHRDLGTPSSKLQLLLAGSECTCRRYKQCTAKTAEGINQSLPAVSHTSTLSTFYFCKLTFLIQNTAIMGKEKPIKFTKGLSSLFSSTKLHLPENNIMYDYK